MTKPRDTASKGLQAWGERAAAALQTGLYAAGQLVEAESVRRCPKDTGELRRNHTVLVGRTNDTLTATIAYEVDVPPEQQYGLQVHECPSSAARYAANLAAHRYRHGKPGRGVPWDVGEDHFLRNAMDAKRGEIADYMAKVVKRCCKK